MYYNVYTHSERHWVLVYDTTARTHQYQIDNHNEFRIMLYASFEYAQT